MKGYQSYKAFNEDFARMVDRLMWTADLDEADNLINDLSTMQESNPTYAIRFLKLADLSDRARSWTRP